LEGVIGLSVMWILATAAVHIVFAVGVYRAAAHLRSCGEQVWFAPAIVWLIATLVGGLLAVAVYWLIHHSQFRAPRRDEL